MMVDKLVEYGDDGELKCPSCGDIHLHHYRVYVKQRFKEDGDGTGITVYSSGGLRIEPMGSAQFPYRRDSLHTYFRCEGCACIPELVLIQHKGSTYLGWV